MIQIITKFNSSIPSVRKVKNWLLNDPFMFGMEGIVWLSFHFSWR